MGDTSTLSKIRAIARLITGSRDYGITVLITHCLVTPETRCEAIVAEEHAVLGYVPLNINKKASLCRIKDTINKDLRSLNTAEDLNKDTPLRNTLNNRTADPPKVNTKVVTNKALRCNNNQCSSSNRRPSRKVVRVEEAVSASVSPPCAVAASPKKGARCAPSALSAAAREKKYQTRAYRTRPGQPNG
ncbi:hypothetical protein LZ554_002815 [Drepanopeziza brunnea f. sp. 'monogermtubi']|nr:hypothetical protein LZ554_002815 [Drepanopeziza brunnea f. sp. 'monogermtubi']